MSLPVLEPGDEVIVTTIYNEVIESLFLGMEDVSGIVVGWKGSPMPEGAEAYRFTRVDGRSGPVGFLRYEHEIIEIRPLS